MSIITFSCLQQPPKKLIGLNEANLSALFIGRGPVSERNHTKESNLNLKIFVKIRNHTLL